MEEKLTHKILHREKVLAKRELKRKNKAERRNARKNTMSEEHRINYYLLKSTPIDNYDKGLEKYYKAKYAREHKEEKEKIKNAKICLGCPKNNNGFCNEHNEWCSICVNKCIKKINRK